MASWIPAPATPLSSWSELNDLPPAVERALWKARAAKRPSDRWALCAREARRLWSLGFTQLKISGMLGLNRGTVARHVRGVPRGWVLARRVRALRKAGRFWHEICIEVGVSKTTLHRHLRAGRI
jgi:hypothetical protein